MVLGFISQLSSVLSLWYFSGVTLRGGDRDGEYELLVPKYYIMHKTE